MPFVEDLARAIARQEGFWDVAGNIRLNTRAAVNNNPGNLRAGPRAIGKDSAGYARYRTLEDGWADLYRQIGLDMDRGLTLSSFLHKYAPASENPTSSYISNVAGWLSIPTDVPLRDLAAGGAVRIPPEPSMVDASDPRWAEGAGLSEELSFSLRSFFAAISESPFVAAGLLAGGAAAFYLFFAD